MSLTAVARFLLVLGTWSMVSCASGPATGISRVKIYRLDPSAVPDSTEPSIPFEQKHYLRGAVSDEDREARRGNYYTVFFRTQDRVTPVHAKFIYRQSATGFKEYSQEATVDPKKGLVRFAVAGEEYRTRGRLLDWQVTLTQGGQVIGQRKSYLR